MSGTGYQDIRVTEPDERPGMRPPEILVREPFCIPVERQYR